MNPYESPKLLAEYLLLHYGCAADVLDGMPGPEGAIGFPSRLVRELLDPASLPVNACAFDLGCAVGGSSFELARTCGEVLGIDFSHSFIEAANLLRKSGCHAFEKAVEGDLTEPAMVEVPPEIARERVAFEQGDAMDLDANPQSQIRNRKSFDVVLAANLLCRLPDPARLLGRLPDLVRPGGQLLLTTPFTWLEEYTPRANWIGGTREGGRSLDALQHALEPLFELEYRIELPFLIREHARKFQYGVALGTRWRRK
ncbi:MAG TPA: putative 4-mercaptohistidine N1-methyltransferase [Chthoniobacterales bacterium]